MPYTFKGQNLRTYRPSLTRPPSGLSPVAEGRENARRRWNRLRQSVMRRVQMQRNIRTSGHARRGRFTVRASPSPSPRRRSPQATLWRNAPPGIYFVSFPYKKGRFTVENIYSYVNIKPKASSRSPR